MWTADGLRPCAIPSGARRAGSCARAKPCASPRSTLLRLPSFACSSDAPFVWLVAGDIIANRRPPRRPAPRSAHGMDAPPTSAPMPHTALPCTHTRGPPRPFHLPALVWSHPASPMPTAGSHPILLALVCSRRSRASLLCASRSLRGVPVESLRAPSSAHAVASPSHSTARPFAPKPAINYHAKIFFGLAFFCRVQRPSGGAFCVCLL